MLRINYYEFSPRSSSLNELTRFNILVRVIIYGNISDVSERWSSASNVKAFSNKCQQFYEHFMLHFYVPWCTNYIIRAMRNTIFIYLPYIFRGGWLELNIRIYIESKICLSIMDEMTKSHAFVMFTWKLFRFHIVFVFQSKTLLHQSIFSYIEIHWEFDFMCTNTIDVHRCLYSADFRILC